MAIGEQLKYGWISGGKTSRKVPMAATQALYNASGKFVYMNAGAATLNADGVGSIFGHLEAHQHTPSEGAELNCIIDLTAVFKIPVNSGTYAVGMIGDQCDISISGTVQGVQLDASVENTLTVVGGDTANNNWVEVMMTPSEWGTGIGVDA